MGKKVKVKPAKTYTRAQALRALSTGEKKAEDFLDMNDPLSFPDPKKPGGTKNHQNYHVRAKCWKMMGCPVYEKDHNKFLESLHIKVVENG